MKKLKVLSLFDGISCGRVALERAGFEIEKYYASEIDKYAIQIAQKNYPDTIQVGDITKLKGEDYNVDLVIGGFPCQSYSIAGKRKGLDDSRGGLIFDIFRILKESQPKQFMLENVKGLLSINKGETFKYILQELNQCGYAVDWIIINSNLVSAQNRERIYILGKRLDICQEMVYITSYDKAKQTQKESPNKRASRVI